MQWIIDAVRVGVVKPLGPHEVPSGIDKTPVDGQVVLMASGLIGDRHGDTRHHGGPEKAVHLYPFDHYAAWREELPGLADRLVAGAFGENLVVGGITEGQVCIGDVFKAGTAVVEISQGRQPCWRLNLRFGIADMARRVQASGRTGWYFRVLEEGMVEPGVGFERIGRNADPLSIAELLALWAEHRPDPQRLREIARMPGLSTRWVEKLEDRAARLPGLI